MFPALTISADFRMPICNYCGAEALDDKTAAAWTRMIGEAFAKELRRRGRDAVAKVCQFISQRQLEKLLGLSQGYLSRLHAERGTPSAALVALLTLLAQEPRQRLLELRLGWDEPSPSERDEIAQLGSSCRRPLPDRGA